VERAWTGAILGSFNEWTARATPEMRNTSDGESVRTLGPAIDLKGLGFTDDGLVRLWDGALPAHWALWPAAGDRIVTDVPIAESLGPAHAWATRTLQFGGAWYFTVRALPTQ